MPKNDSNDTTKTLATSNRATVDDYPIHDPATLAPDIDAARRFLGLLDPTTNIFLFQTFAETPDAKRDPDHNGKYLRTLYGTFDQHVEQLIALNRQGAGVFVTVQDTDGCRRKKENVTRIRAVFQEADQADVPTLPCKPHIEVESSPGKFHRYILTEDALREEFESVQQRLVDDYGSDANAKDRSRGLRVATAVQPIQPDAPHTLPNTPDRPGAPELPGDMETLPGFARDQPRRATYLFHLAAELTPVKLVGTFARDLDQDRSHSVRHVRGQYARVREFGGGQLARPRWIER